MLAGMEIVSSRSLLRPRDRSRTLDFYERVLELPIYREFGSHAARGVVFFLGGGFLEVSGEADEPSSDATQLWLQVRDLDAAHQHLVAHEVVVEEGPVTKPWGLYEMRVRDPDGRLLVFVEVPEEHPLRRDSRSRL